MPNGILTPQQTALAKGIAEGFSISEAGRKAGYRHAPTVSKTLGLPHVQQAIVDAQIAALNNDILPLAIAAHRRLLTDPKTPAGAVAQAVKLAYDRTLGMQEGRADKEPHEMSAEELVAAIHNLERIKADRARPIIEGETVEAGVFE